MGREGIQRVVIMAASGKEGAIQQFVPVKLNEFGGIPVAFASDELVAIPYASYSPGIINSQVFKNTGAKGLHIVVNDTDWAISHYLRIDVEGYSPIAATYHTIRRFDEIDASYLVGISASLQLYPGLTDNTTDKTIQRLESILTSQWRISAVLSGTSSDITFGITVTTIA